MNNFIEVLIVDDDAAIRELLTAYLGDFGIRASSASNGTEMQWAMEVRRFDIIILDLMLPQEDGLALCRKLQKPILNPRNSTSPLDSSTGWKSNFALKPFASKK